jgi:hypothetical protein
MAPDDVAILLAKTGRMENDIEEIKASLSVLAQSHTDFVLAQHDHCADQAKTCTERHTGMREEFIRFSVKNTVINGLVAAVFTTVIGGIILLVAEKIMAR